jgi:hypothetical protein
MSLNIRTHTLTHGYVPAFWSCSDNSAEMISEQCRNVLRLRLLSFCTSVDGDYFLLGYEAYHNLD